MFSSVLSLGFLLAFSECVTNAAEPANLCEQKIPVDEDVDSLRTMTQRTGHNVPTQEREEEGRTYKETYKTISFENVLKQKNHKHP